MIKTRILSTLTGMALLATSSYALAEDDPMLGVIKARQSYMQLVKWNAGPLFAMAKGEMDYNPELAAMLAANLAALSGMQNGGSMWIEGSDNVAYEGETRALAEIWSNNSGFIDAYDNWSDAVAGLQDTASFDLDSLRDGVGALGKSCKGCHDDFRAKDD